MCALEYVWATNSSVESIRFYFNTRFSIFENHFWTLTNMSRVGESIQPQLFNTCFISIDKSLNSKYYLKNQEFLTLGPTSIGKSLRFEITLHKDLMSSILVLWYSENMASEAPSWADQWGAGGIGAIEDDDHDTVTRSQKDTGGKNKISGSKSKAGFSKAKAVAMIGLEKIKSRASICVKWIKTQFKKRRTSI